MCNIINIAIASDNNYLQLVGICLKSLFDTNKERRIHVHLLTNNIQDNELTPLYDITPAGNLLSAYPLQNLESMLGVNVPSTISITSYARLFLPSILPDNVDRVLYIDCDILFCDRIDEFYDAEIGNALIGGVHDLLLSPIYKKKLDIPANEVYFNAGVLLIPVRRWREERMQEQFIQYLVDHKGVVYHHDQGVINAVCRGRKYIAPPRYNVISNYFIYPYKYVTDSTDGFYSEHVYKEASAKPAIIHFTGCIHGRPWETQCSHPYRQRFLSTKADTPFKDIPLAPVRQNRISRFEATCYRHFPFRFYYTMIRLIFWLSSLKKKLC